LKTQLDISSEDLGIYKGASRVDLLGLRDVQNHLALKRFSSAVAFGNDNNKDLSPESFPSVFKCLVA